MSEYDTLLVQGMYTVLCVTEFGGGETSRIRKAMVSANLLYDYRSKELCERGPQPIQPLRDSALYHLQSVGYYDLAISAWELVSKLGNAEAPESVAAAMHDWWYRGNPGPQYRSLEPARFHPDYKNKKDDGGQETSLA
ncbi:hypothetical protein DL764_001443 [Monosporascus ibericus]|uniref:Uncharacterized protein n=1 Tax=Monosporascus ibericus TaxID=155417 RepID=A0A4Q4TR60_9PEZI|nr:hypothetical protein DL764_001443 [Monosporascus ibericus]